jgi:hypothetical protein
VAAAPPVSAALAFHLLLRLLDRATLLGSVAEAYEERGIEGKARAALRKARRAAIKSGSATGVEGASDDQKESEVKRRPRLGGANDPRPQLSVVTPEIAERAPGNDRTASDPADARVQLADLRDRVHDALAARGRVTGDTVGRWLGASPRSGRRRLAALVDDAPCVADALARD